MLHLIFLFSLKKNPENRINFQKIKSKRKLPIIVLGIGTMVKHGSDLTTSNFDQTLCLLRLKSMINSNNRLTFLGAHACQLFKSVYADDQFRNLIEWKIKRFCILKNRRYFVCHKLSVQCSLHDITYLDLNLF